MYKTYCLLACLLLSIIAIAQTPQQFPSGTTGEFVSRDVDTGKYFRVNAEGCAKRYSPYSTFKIPNSLIGLETGVVTDPNEKWHWDSAKYPAPNPGPGGDYVKIWQQDNNMRTALANSIVWYYRELATKVGERRMKQWLARFRYGNQDISAGLDHFWLGNSMKISPDEQVEFLTKLQGGQFPVAKKNLDIVKEILTQDSTPAYKLIAKTGSSGDGEGWLVGWVERSAGGGCSFALHLRSPSHSEMAKLRPGIAREMLKKAGCL